MKKHKIKVYIVLTCPEGGHYSDIELEVTGLKYLKSKEMWNKGSNYRLIMNAIPHNLKYGYSRVIGITGVKILK